MHNAKTVSMFFLYRMNDVVNLVTERQKNGLEASLFTSPLPHKIEVTEYSGYLFMRKENTIY